MTSPVSRRDFVNLVGRAGGAAAVYGTLDAMGLLRPPAADAGSPKLSPGSGRGVHVAILGAGVAGLTAAYELSKAGYRCTVLEARERAGDITQMWYPSHGLHAAKGILIGAYIWTSPIGERFAAMTPPERHAAAVADGTRIHSGYAGLVERGVSVAWSKIPFSLGAYVQWSDDATAARDALPTLAENDGPFHFAGEHVSHVPGWIEGAVRSAHASVARIAARAAVPLRRR